MSTPEQFDSATQQSLFDSTDPDEFLSGLSRAFTLASPEGARLQNTVARERLSVGGARVATFHNRGTGEAFFVTVERVLEGR